MEVFALDNFNKLKPSTIPMEKSHFHLPDGSDQDTSTSATYICIILQLLIKKGSMASLLTTMWDQTNVRKN